MAKVNKSLLKQWQDGQVMHGPDYNRERDLLVDAYNDTQTQVDNLKNTPSVSTGMLQDGSVTEPKIGTGAVTNSKLGAKSVTNDKLGDSSVGTSTLANGAVTEAKLGTGAVTSGKLGAGAVGTDKLADGSVTAPKIGSEAVTGPKIAPSSVGNAHLQNNTINGSEKLLDGSVTDNKLGNESVTSGKLRDGSVTPSKITKDAVTQYTYDQATIDARIAASVSGAIPQDVIDQIREDVDSSVTDLQNRLDNDSTWNATLNPGRSVINSFKSTKFDLSSLKGRTLLNQLGRQGRFGQGTVVVGFFGDTKTTISTSGGSNPVNYLRVELASGTSGTGGPSLMVPIPSGEYFVAVGDIRVDSASSMSAAVGIQGAFGNTVTDFATYRPSFLRFTRAVTGGDTRVGLFVQGSAGSYALMRDLRVYRVSQAEYDALATMSPEAVAAKYPYVDDMKPVRNPYVRRYGSNLLPQFSEWKAETGTHTVIGPYTIDLSKTTTGFNTVSTIAADVVPGADYTFQTTVEVSNISGTVDNGAYFIIFAFDKDGAVVGTNMAAPPYATVNGTRTLKATFKAPVDAAYLKVSLSVSTGVFGNFIFKNPRVSLGTILSGDFQPREDAILALQTDLNANPHTGADADEVFEENGQYFKLAKWRGMTLDGSVVYEISAARPYMKWVTFQILNGPNANDGNKFASVKYNGSVLKLVPGSLSSGSSPDQLDYGPGNPSRLHLSISNSDSGWGDRDLVQLYENVAANRITYTITPTAGISVIKVNNVLINNVPYANWSLSGNTVTLEVAPTMGSTVTINYVGSYIPTADEIKAYFMGWYMGDSSGNWGPYNGTGTKGWIPRDSTGKLVQGVGVGTLPTTPSTYGFTPYQLVYQLNAPVVEPVVSEGMLTFNEGDNQIEVGSGMVAREYVIPYTNSTIGMAGINAPSSPNYPGTGLKNKVRKLLTIFRNSRPDNSWTVKPGNAGGGLEYADAPLSQYDPTAAYTVTYLMLDGLPVSPVAGSYDTSENAMLRSLTETVQQNATAVSALMQRKVEKDAPAILIAPTLINGWKQYPSYQTVGYRKDSAGVVHLTGLAQSGPISSHIFRLPVGFRPKRPLIFPVCASAGANRVDVQDDGHIFFNWAGTWDSAAWVSLDGISFVAEQ